MQDEIWISDIWIWAVLCCDSRKILPSNKLEHVVSSDWQLPYAQEHELTDAPISLFPVLGEGRSKKGAASSKSGADKKGAAAAKDAKGAKGKEVCVEVKGFSIWTWDHLVSNILEKRFWSSQIYVSLLPYWSIYITL
jgi:hypothetical protein